MKQTQHMEIPQKPLILRKEDAETDIVNAINRAAAVHSLCYSDLEDIMFKYYTEVKRSAENERREAREKFNAAADAYRKQKKEEVRENAENNQTDQA